MISAKEKIKVNETYNPFVSIVIPVYNGSNYLAEAIDSAISQTYKNIEIIVVNDGSNDQGKTEKIALSYGNKIRYFSKENGGSSSALNYGIRHMLGEWFSWLSHDDLYYPDKVQNEIEFLTQIVDDVYDVSNHVVFCGAELIRGDGSILRKANLYQLKKKSEMLKMMKSNEMLIARQMSDYNFHGCGCLIHKSVFDKIGMFDEKLRLLNDIDMWFRIYSSDYRLELVPRVLVKGRVHAKQISTSIGYSYHNSEQDMFWDRTLQWICDNCKANFSIFYAYAQVAFQKTRNVEGKKASLIAASIKPNKRFSLTVVGTFCRFKSTVRTVMKRVYLAIIPKA